MGNKKRSIGEAKNRMSGDIIKELRARLGLTQEQFAAKVGVTWSTVNRWENGRGKPSPLALRQIVAMQRRLATHADS